MKALKDVDDPDLDCKNPELYLEQEDIAFSISPVGLVFYISRYGDQSLFFDQFDEPLAVLVPYNLIKQLIPLNSSLRKYLN